MTMLRRWTWGRSWLGWVLSGMLVVGACGAPEVQAQSDGSAEVRALREELEKVKAEVSRLREENARLRGGAGVPSAPAPVVQPGATAAPARPAVAPASPTVPSVVVPQPIEPGAAVTVEQVLADYRTSTLAGDARYKGRRFQVTGPVRSFKKTFVGLTWIVELQGGDGLGIVRCPVSWPGFSDFRPGAGNRILEGRRPFREWQKLLEVGEEISVEGLGAGVDGALVLMKDCHPLVTRR